MKHRLSPEQKILESVRKVKLENNLSAEPIEDVKDRVLRHASQDEEGRWHVPESVIISRLGWDEWYISFAYVEGDFDCSDNNLHDLHGAPDEVRYGNFDCSNNPITALEGAPHTVGGDFVCSFCNLNTLQGGPNQVHGDFFCDHNSLPSLENAPEFVLGDFHCNDNQIPKEEIERYKATGAVQGKIWSDIDYEF